MPYIATYTDTGERIDISLFDDPRNQIRKEGLVCPLCGDRMIIKAGMIIEPHFAHYSKCTCPYDRHPESAEHLYGKKFVRKYIIQRQYKQYISTAGVVENLDIQFEYPVPEVGRIADIMVTFPMGWRIAHEIQLSAITIEHLYQRTLDYANAGIDTVWWIGMKADTKKNREWCISFFGEYNRLQFDNHLKCFYHEYEDGYEWII